MHWGPSCTPSPAGRGCPCHCGEALWLSSTPRGAQRRCKRSPLSPVPLPTNIPCSPPASLKVSLNPQAGMCSIQAWRCYSSRGRVHAARWGEVSMRCAMPPGQGWEGGPAPNAPRFLPCRVPRPCRTRGRHGGASLRPPFSPGSL